MLPPHALAMGVWVDVYSWCVKDWGVNVLTSLMSQRDSYSSVSVSTVTGT